jgi:hypothetical protein
VLKAEEPLVSYEQVLLSQISYCAKVSSDEFPLCVDNLISLLPSELRAEVIKEYREVGSTLVKYIVEEVKGCTLEEWGLDCDLKMNIYDARNVVVSKVRAERPDLYMKHGHVLSDFVLDLLASAARLQDLINPVARSKLKFSIVLRKLLELQIVAPKSSAIYVGRVEG